MVRGRTYKKVVEKWWGTSYMEQLPARLVRAARTYSRNTKLSITKMQTHFT